MSNFDCEVLIVGAGPAGMAAALAAAESGGQVRMIDDNPHPGGQIWRDGPQVALSETANRYRQAIATRENIALQSGCKLVAQCGAGRLAYEDAEGCGVIRYQKLILCNGARELLLPFPGWTLPGVTGAGGLQAQIKQGLTIHGERVVIAGSGPLLLAVANSVKQAGGEVVLVAEQAPLWRLAAFAGGLWRWPAKLRQAFSLMPRRYCAGSRVPAALGQERLTSVRVNSGGKERTIACDRLACGFGLVANIELAMLLGCRIEQDAVAVDHWQQTSQAHIYAAGECTGIGGSELALIEGAIAGYAAIGQKSKADSLAAQRRQWRRFATTVASTFALDERLSSLANPQTLLCRCEDVTLEQVRHQPDWNTAKLSSRCGMGACQGKICATAARQLLGWPLSPPRVPLTPVRTETLVALGLSCSDDGN
ncbi:MULTISPECIES: NAD(P)/FAD-dependent oxidoreductase [Serratia]|uniref:NAD(P)/FAD-dependent oxidoreductase n=1 Tax=Serratia TaxID=613 RepID=UPI000F7E4CA1|nr:FAD/NAD(P)-binding oxidoreductase [Serratia marcescens]MBI6134732.1 NAD(P)/FAD-dependent oxidoreductase [Serratia marcescens]MDN0030613.1 FAD/NAD(P)-binding oxidoreductase [Serratia marcescens]NSM19031.1 FAD-dependent oxidoreductase [Serratia marcescens]NSM49438.1 FAD-dependent oxidoreductase [Serratia marcescens]RTF13812.1 NAD(P)/FAD-dependent oxidoreductase [Serratia marcescens]